MAVWPNEGLFGGEIPRAEIGEGLGSAKARREPRLAGMRLRDGTKIEGTIHVLPFSRPMDLLNNRDDVFMAVTDATLTEPNGSQKHFDFVAVSRSDIVFLYELKETT